MADMSLDDFYRDQQIFSRTDDHETIRASYRQNFATLDAGSRAATIKTMTDILDRSHDESLQKKVPLISQIRELTEIDRLLLDSNR